MTTIPKCALRINEPDGAMKVVNLQSQWEKQSPTKAALAINIPAGAMRAKDDAEIVLSSPGREESA